MGLSNRREGKKGVASVHAADTVVPGKKLNYTTLKGDGEKFPGKTKYRYIVYTYIFREEVRN